MKHYHSEAIDRAIRYGDISFNRSEFLAALHEIRTALMKPKTIRSSFKKTRLVPFNPQEVLNKLTIEVSDNSSVSSDNSSISSLIRTTPRKIH